MSEIKDEFIKLESEFEGFIRTVEFHFFKGKLHQKALAPHTGQTPSHVWVPVESHDEAAPKPGEPLPGTKPADTEPAIPLTATDVPGFGVGTPATLTGTLTTGATHPVVIDTPAGVMTPVPAQPTPQTVAAQAQTTPAPQPSTTPPASSQPG